MKTSYNPAAEIVGAMFAPEQGGAKVRAYFKSGHADAVYSAALLPMLATDPGVAFVTCEETGEILYSAES